MSRMFALAAHDARLQYRYGIYAAYIFVVGFYLLVLTVGRDVLPAWTIGFVIYTDPAVVGFFFLGALMMLEKAEGVRTALAASPVTSAQYLVGKMLTLSGLALLACVLMLLVHGSTENPALLLAAAALTSISFIGIGVPIALGFRTVNEYLIGAGAFLTPVIAPGFLALIEPMPAWLGLWPPVAQFRLMLVALGHASAGPIETVLFLGVASAAAVAATWFALVSLRREFGK